MYESEILTIYKADNGFVVKCKEPPKAETKGNSELKSYSKDEMNVYQSLAQVIKKVKEELAAHDLEDDEKEEEAKEGKDSGKDKSDEEEYKSAFKKASKKA